MRNPTPPAVVEAIDAVLQSAYPTNLYDRWQDEKEYEDFEDYKKAFAKFSGFTVVRATKKPFAFFFKVAAFPEATYELRVTARSAFWRRIP